MSSAQIALLADRGVVRVAGADAEKLLQGIITNDMDLLASQPAIHAALLTPQGKILFEFFVVKAGDGFLLETARDKAADLAKRLSLYKLRAKVDDRGCQRRLPRARAVGRCAAQLRRDDRHRLLRRPAAAGAGLAHPGRGEARG